MTLHPYCSNSGRNLINEYIDSLSIEEQVDGYTVLEHMENGEFEKIYYKPWKRRYMKYIFKNIIVYFTLQ